MKSISRSQNGFTLAELMVVVAIIGTLTAIAVPNYMIFAAKARQSEAKTLLSDIYAAEMNFHAEWQVYFADWRDIGFSPVGSLHYIVGFSVPFDPIPAGIGYSGPSYTGPQPNPPIGAGVVNNNNGYCGTTILPDCRTLATAYAGGGSPVWGATVVSNVNPQHFVIGAAGLIGTNPGIIDAWTLDSGKAMLNVVDGTQ